MRPCNNSIPQKITFSGMWSEEEYDLGLFLADTERRSSGSGGIFMGLGLTRQEPSYYATLTTEGLRLLKPLMCEGDIGSFKLRVSERDEWSVCVTDVYHIGMWVIRIREDTIPPGTPYTEIRGHTPKLT